MCILFPDSQLKPQLLASHRADRFQKIQKLHQLGDSGDKKPSELLASMMDLCKRAKGLPVEAHEEDEDKPDTGRTRAAQADGLELGGERRSTW